jgi:hypothetical protein
MGLASRYPGDVGIDADPAVVFTEDFEQASLADLLAGWEYHTHPERMSLDADVPPGSGGSRSLRLAGSADLYTRLLPARERLYLRFYARLDGACRRVHHWVWLGGHDPSTAWPWPRAGERPVGDERFSTGVEPYGDAWAWDLYTYWMHMRGNPVPDTYWGNTFSGRPSPWPAERDRWLCVELMVQMNRPVSSYNGEQAFWIDGVRRAHLGPGFPAGNWVWDGFYPDPGGQPFEGFQWRAVPELAINYLWLEHYVDTDPGCGVRFDHLVVASEYVGPMVAAGLRVLRSDRASELPASPDTTFVAASLPFRDPDGVLAPPFPPHLFYQVEGVARTALVRQGAALWLHPLP